MSIELDQMEGLHRMEVDVRQRPNGPRVLRLLRELDCLDGKLTNSILHAGDFPLVTIVFTAVMMLLAVAVENLPPHARSTPTPAALPVVVEPSVQKQAVDQTQEYRNFLSQANVRAAAQ